MSNRSVIAVCMLALTLAACPKKEEVAAVDAAPSATPVATEAPAAAASAEPDKAGEPAAAAAPAEKAGNKDVPSTPKAAADAGAATAATDAGATAVDTCCCDVPGEAPAQVGQSECTKTKKGQCVKKDKCAAVPVSVDAGPAVQQCCCDSAGTKKLRGQSECTKGGAGKCVKMAECK